jgi:DNA polymerase-3 subunit beta
MATSGVLMVAGDLDVTLSAFNYDTSAATRVAAEVGVEGTCLVSAAVLARIASAAHGQEVEFVVDDGSATLTCGKSVWRNLPLLHAYDFPTMPKPGEPIGHVRAEDLAGAVKRVAPSVSKVGDADAAFSAILMEFDQETVTLAGTDRNCLVATQVAWTPAGPVDDFRALIPSGGLADLVGAAEGDVGVSFVLRDDKPVIAGMTSPRSEHTTRVLDANFPNWRSYMAGIDAKFKEMREAGAGTLVTLEVEPLLDALKELKAVSSQDPKNPPTVSLDIGGDGVARLLGGHDVAFATEVPVKVDGPAVLVKMKLAYLNAAATAVKGFAEMTMSIFGAVKPIMVRPVTEIPRHHHLIMPLRQI